MELLRPIPLLALDDAGEQLDIQRLLQPVTLTAGQVLFAQGEQGHAMWVLGDGVEVSLSAQAPGAPRPRVMGTLRAGDTVGEMALIDHGGRSATARVVQGGGAQVVDSRAFAELLGSYSVPAFKVLRHLCVELAKRLRGATDLVVPPAPERPSPPPLSGGRKASETDLEKMTPFLGLPQALRLAFAQRLTVHELNGALVFAEGEPADSAYLIASGRVAVMRGDKVLAHLGPGSMLGLVSLLDEGRRSASCVTEGPVRLLRLSRADFNTLFTSANTFAFSLVRVVAAQLVAHIRSTNQLMMEPPKSPAASTLPLELEMDVRLDIPAT